MSSDWFIASIIIIFAVCLARCDYFCFVLVGLFVCLILLHFGCAGCHTELFIDNSLPVEEHHRKSNTQVFSVVSVMVCSLSEEICLCCCHSISPYILCCLSC